jgi:hypothetical protein
MSLLNLTKRALTRPISSSACIAVGIAFLSLLLYKTRSDRSVQQPVTTRKMHIQSIPMCECALRVFNNLELQSRCKLLLMWKWTTPLERERGMYILNAD